MATYLAIAAFLLAFLALCVALYTLQRLKSLERNQNNSNGDMMLLKEGQRKQIGINGKFARALNLEQDNQKELPVVFSTDARKV